MDNWSHVSQFIGLVNDIAIEWMCAIESIGWKLNKCRDYMPYEDIKQIAQYKKRWITLDTFFI